MKHSITATKWTRRSWLTLTSAVAAFLTVGATSTLNVTAQHNDDPQIAPLYAKTYGKTYPQWSAAWWQWLLETPLEGHPSVDSPDFNIRTGQQGNVWFLAGPLGTFTRDINIPAGKALYIGVLNAEASTLEEAPFHGDTAAEQAAAAQDAVDHILNLYCTIDNETIAIEDYRILSPQISINAPTPWLFGNVGGEGTSVGDGYFILLRPMDKGTHTIHFGGVFHFTLAEDGFDADIALDMTYHVTVK
jgi:hypothetical protein